MGVQAIGGLFFRARDPDALNRWYKEHLGVGSGCAAEDTGPPEEWSWKTAGGPVVFSAFKADTDYFAADKQFMLNLRVTDLAGLLERLRGAGVAVITNPEWDSTEAGSFSRIHDPEGNAIELWEMPA